MFEATLLFLCGAAVVCAFSFWKSRYVDFLGQRPEHFAGKGPQFDVRTHLNGAIVCEGVIYGPTGRVSSRFVGDFEAHWDGNVGTMKEHFRYDSGFTQDREWRLTVGNDGSIKAEAPDVIGSGTGQQTGPAVLLNYRIRLPEESGGYVLNTTDWMYLVENGSIINRSQFRKYGFKVAELVATMRQKEAA